MRRTRPDKPTLEIRPEPAWRVGHYDGPTSETGRIEWAKYLATGILPPLYRNNPGACLSLLMKAQALDIPIDTAKENVFWNEATGKGGITAQLMVLLLHRHGYDFKVTEETDKRVAMTFYQVVSGRRRRLGDVEWTILEAIGAGIAWRDTWQQYPTDMLWARCLMRGARRYGRGVGTGLAYTAEEVADMSDPADGSEVHTAVADILTRATAPGVTSDEIRGVLVKEARAKHLLELDTGDGQTLGYVLGLLWGERRTAEADARAAQARPAPDAPADIDMLECGCNAAVVLATGEHQVGVHDVPR
jgi:hypothetical protein